MIATLIPAQERKDILDQNLIANSKAIQGDPAMEILMIYWRTYVEPSLKANCNVCYERVHKNWRAIQADLINLEKASNLLNDIN